MQNKVRVCARIKKGKRNLREKLFLAVILVLAVLLPCGSEAKRRAPENANLVFFYPLTRPPSLFSFLSSHFPPVPLSSAPSILLPSSCCRRKRSRPAKQSTCFFKFRRINKAQCASIGYAAPCRSRSTGTLKKIYNAAACAWRCACVSLYIRYAS